jgi:hypothetical protein
MHLCLSMVFFNLEQRFSTSGYLRTPNSKAVPKLYPLKHWNLAIMILQSINVIFSFKFNYLSTLVDVSFNWESCSFDSFSHKVYFLNCHKNFFLRTLCKLLGYVVESRWHIGYLELLLSQKLVILNPAIFIFLFKKLPTSMVTFSENPYAYLHYFIQGVKNMLRHSFLRGSI